jgi:hypothetical protein
MLDNMSVSNACEAMQAAVTYGQDELRERTLSYIEQNTSVSWKAWQYYSLCGLRIAGFCQCWTAVGGPDHHSAKKPSLGLKVLILTMKLWELALSAQI